MRWYPKLDKCGDLQRSKEYPTNSIVGNSGVKCMASTERNPQTKIPPLLTLDD